MTLVRKLFAYRLNTKAHKILLTTLKVLSVVLGFVYMWQTLSDPYMERNIFAFREVCPELSSRILISFVKFFLFGSIVTCLAAPFFRFRCTDKIVRYFVPVVVLVRFILTSDMIRVALGPGVTDSINTYLIVPQFFVEQIILTFICIGFWVLYLFKERVPEEKKEFWKNFGLSCLVFFLLCVINLPFSFLTGIFGPSYQTALDFSVPHRILIYSSVILPFVVMMIFRHKPYHVRWYICLQFSIAAFFCFFRRSDFRSIVNPETLPLHLCNTGVIIMLVAFVFRCKPAFYFAYLINVLGAYFACFMPNKTGDLFYANSLLFWHNHLADICIPFVAIGLKVFSRPKFKFVFYSLIAFAVYFLIAATLDSIYWDRGVDYFFLNSDKFTEVIKGAEHIRTNIVITFTVGGKQIIIRWLYWLIIFVVYCGLAVAMWFLYSLLYRVSDSHVDLHFKAIRDKEIIEQRKLLLITQEETSMIEISHLTKVYGTSEQKAVNDFSLTVKPGEVFGFLGHNGAGKSTLIKCLTGIQPITDGSIKVFGKDIKVDPKGVKRMIGYVPDNHAVYEGLTGREYVNYIADLYLVTTEERTKRLEEYAEKFKITAALDKPIKDYSHGMKQKITIIAALIHEPKVWILDEPLTGLDPYSIYQIKQCMKEHAAKGNIVFFSSHVIDVVENVCTRIAIISHGEKKYEASIDNLKKQNIKLEDIYLQYVSNADSR